MDLVLIFYGCGGFDVLYCRIDEFEGTNGLYSASQPGFLLFQTRGL